MPMDDGWHPLIEGEPVVRARRAIAEIAVAPDRSAVSLLHLAEKTRSPRLAGALPDSASAV